MNQNRQSITIVERLLNAYRIHSDLIDLIKGNVSKVTVSLHDGDDKYTFVFYSDRVMFKDDNYDKTFTKASWHLNGTNVVILQSSFGNCNRIDLTLQNLVSES